MENEVNNILQTINEGLKTLPDYASEGWELMVQGTKVDGIIGLTFSTLFTVLLTALTFYVIRFYRKYEETSSENDHYDCDIATGLVMASWILAGVTLLCIIIYFTFIPDYIRSIFMPEYQLIKELMSNVNS